MSQLLPMREIADDIEWAHCCPWYNLPTSFNGPIVVYDKGCQYHGMGPIVAQGKCCQWYLLSPLVRKHTGDIEWAHCCSWEKLPITLNGPTAAHEEYCQWLWIVPLFLMRRITNDIEWANYCSCTSCRWLYMCSCCRWGNCRRPWMGPFLLIIIEKVTVDCERTHYCP